MAKQPTGHVWRLIQDFAQRQRFVPSQREMATELGVASATLGTWKHCRSMPNPQHLRRIADVLDVPYSDVLTAAMVDAGYLVESELVVVQDADVEVFGKPKGHGHRHSNGAPTTASAGG